jgi:hypothetical protein
MDSEIMPTPVEEAIGVGRRETLEAIRRRLAQILDGTVGHKRGCECECGMPWDTGKVAAIARELREVVRELDDLPTKSGGSEVERIQSEREARRLQAEREATGAARE